MRSHLRRCWHVLLQTFGDVKASGWFLWDRGVYSGHRQAKNTYIHKKKACLNNKIVISVRDLSLSTTKKTKQNKSNKKWPGQPINCQAECEWNSSSKTLAELQVQAVTANVTFFVNNLFLWFADHMLHHLPSWVVFYKTSCYHDCQCTKHPR